VSASQARPRRRSCTPEPKPALMKQIARDAGASAYVAKSQVSQELLVAIDGLLSSGT
jgi:hypothetical protein